MTDFTPCTFCVLSVSDTRNAQTDGSGKYLQQAVIEAGHLLVDYQIVKDEIHQIQKTLNRWIKKEPPPVVILLTGGTGFKQRDRTPEAVQPMLDREIPGFGELFRMISWQEIGPSTIQSRVLAGMIQACFVFCLPGSPSACRTAWTSILQHQFDSRSKPCNFVEIWQDWQPEDL